MRKYGLVLVAACALAPQLANAAGYALREHSADAMGAAYAGSAATGTDASYMVYNPASLGFVGGTDFSASIAGIFVDSSSRYGATTSALTPVSGPSSPGSFVSNAAVPALALRWRVADRWALGVSVSAPWGLVTSYPKDWVGRYYGIDTKLTTINITPLISYEISPHVVIAAGPQAQYANGTFTNAIDVGTLTYPLGTPGADDIYAQFKAKGWGWGWTVGLMAQLNDAFSVGVAYRSSIDTTAKGHLNFQGVSTNPYALGVGIFNNGAAQTSLTTPAMVNLGARWHVCDNWNLLGEADWTEWSVFKNLTIKPASVFLPPDFTATNWNDSWFFALGAEYMPSDRWTLKAGTAYDESPIPGSTKGPRIPDNNRTWLSLGARYHASDSIDLSFSAAHLFFANSKVNLQQTNPGSSLRGNLAGVTKGSANIVAVQISFHS
jgi:long-chain fatty acid transport protein